jgi:hypothetical protein
LANSREAFSEIGTEGGAIETGVELGRGVRIESLGASFAPKGHIVGVGLSFDGRFMSGLSADSSKDLSLAEAAAPAISRLMRRIFEISLRKTVPKLVQMTKEPTITVFEKSPNKQG